MINTSFTSVEDEFQKNFLIQFKIGDGSFSSVFKVIRKEDGLEYAMKKIKVKSLTEKEKINALSELQILASVRDPNVILYKECMLDSQNAFLYIIMEYADDGDLSQKVQYHKKLHSYLKEETIWTIFIQILKGLKSLHDLKIYHRDIKSANIFLWKDGRAKLGDMNVSKLAKNDLVHTQTGTPFYASPEVWSNQPYDHKADIWSIGCLLYEMCNREPPFQAEDLRLLHKQINKGEYDDIPGHYSNEIREIIKLCLQKNPRNRLDCNELLSHPIITKLLQKFPKNLLMNADKDNETSVMLQTIHFNENLSELSAQLPKSNYSPLKTVPFDRYFTPPARSDQKQKLDPKYSRLVDIAYTSNKNTFATSATKNIINIDLSRYRKSNNIFSQPPKDQPYKIIDCQKLTVSDVPPVQPRPISKRDVSNSSLASKESTVSKQIPSLARPIKKSSIKLKPLNTSLQLPENTETDDNDFKRLDQNQSGFDLDSSLRLKSQEKKRSNIRIRAVSKGIETNIDTNARRQSNPLMEKIADKISKNTHLITVNNILNQTNMRMNPYKPTKIPYTIKLSQPMQQLLIIKYQDHIRL